jgi:hypothetical protein
MTSCADCKQEMATAVGCTLSALTIDGALYLRRRCTCQRCRDCGAKPERIHHLGCEVERCPRCGNQLITCGCWSDGPGEPDEDG